MRPRFAGTQADGARSRRGGGGRSQMERSGRRTVWWSWYVVVIDDVVVVVDVDNVSFVVGLAWLNPKRTIVRHRCGPRCMHNEKI